MSVTGHHVEALRAALAWRDLADTVGEWRAGETRRHQAASHANWRTTQLPSESSLAPPGNDERREERQAEDEEDREQGAQLRQGDGAGQHHNRKANKREDEPQPDTSCGYALRFTR